MNKHSLLLRNKTKKQKVVILGAGLSGLACADEILRKGKNKLEVVILEKNSFIGGLAATFKKDGFLFDLAPHRWFTKNEELNKWIDELMGKEMIWVKKYTPMYQFGKFYKYPFEIGDIIKKIDPLKMIAMLGTYGWTKISSRIFPKKILTMKDAYINRFGYALYKWFCEEFNNKLWEEGGCEIMSADFVAQRTRDLSMITIIKNTLGLGGKIVSLLPVFVFPNWGLVGFLRIFTKESKKTAVWSRRKLASKKLSNWNPGIKLKPVREFLRQIF